MISKYSPIVLIAAIILVINTGCATVGNPTSGFLYTNAKYPIMATESAGGRKQGVACQSSILGWFSTGDASIEAAKTSAGITKVASVDAQANSVLGIYARYCTVVKGD